MRFFLRALIFGLITTCAMAQNHPGWPRQELEMKAAELLGVDQLKMESVPELPRNLFYLDPAESSSCFKSAEDSIVGFYAGEFSSVLLIGNAENVHTLWAYFPILSVRDTDEAFKFYAEFLDYLVPNWPQSETWAKDSLVTSWEASSKAYQDPMISINDMIARETVNGVKLSTAGVPPDIVYYRITSKAQCEHISDYLLAKPRRALRDPAKRNTTQEIAGIRLHYTKPVPVDVSSTPIFLGAVGGNRTINTTEKVIRLSAPGPHSGTIVELQDWLSRQTVPPESNDIWSIVEEDWGYERDFLFSITEPRLVILNIEEKNVLLLDMVSGTAQRTMNSDYDLDWHSFSGLLFGSEMKPWQDDRSPDPPYRIVNKGEVLLQNEGSAVPVNVQSTPIHRGMLRQYLRANKVEVPVPYSASINGMTVLIEESGDKAELDLNAWFALQEGAPVAPKRPRPISHPAIPFELGERKHLLVVSYVSFLAPEGEPASIQGLMGQMFSAP